MDVKRNEAASKAIGRMCSLVPEEVVMAAGLEPRLIYGRMGNVEKAEAYFSSNVCPHLKNILDSALRGNFGDLSGMVLATSCDGVRRMRDLWERYVETPPVFFLEVPKLQTQEGIAYFTDRLLRLKDALETAFSVEITEEKLRQAISLMNEHRRLVTALFEAQKTDPPGYRGSELWAAIHEEATLPKAGGTVRLEELSARVKRPPLGKGGPGEPRILVTGNVMNRPDLFGLIENAGGMIVAFDTCEGLRHYDSPVEDGANPWEALARRYLTKPSCPRMPGFTARLERLQGLIRDYRVHGVIYSNLMFCDYGMFETPQLEAAVSGHGLPFLALENDYIWADKERLRTRVEAFVEMVRTNLP